MAIRVLPYRAATRDVWTVADWTRRSGDSEEEVIASSSVGDFDYTSVFTFGYRGRVHCKALRQATGLSADAEVAAYALLDCPSGQVRLFDSVPFQLKGDVAVEVDVAVEAGTICDAITLERGLVLVAPGSEEGELTPRLHFARLYSDQPLRLRLEGSWSRFPLQALDFKSSRWSANAAWALSVSFDEPSDPFMACVRVSVNTGHAAGLAVLGREDSTLGRELRSALQTDIVRQLFSAVSGDHRFSEPGVGSVDGSIGAVLESLSHLHLNLPLADALARLRSDPAHFDTLLQDRFGYLAQGSE